MPQRGKAWWHVMWSTRCAWLPGDKRGFCNFDHRIHSSGDYKNPPPREEHEGLRKYHEARSGDEIKLPVECRKIIADAIAKVLIEAGHQVWIVAVATNHVHFLAEVPIDLAAFQTLIATCKNKSSRAVDDLPGRIWGRGEDHVMVTSRSHRKNVYKYLRDKQAKDARHWKLDIKFSDDP